MNHAHPRRRARLASYVANVGLGLLLAWPAVRAQAPTTSFALLGHIQELEVANPNDPLSEGSLVVNGIRVVLPRNLHVVMPGMYLTPADLFRGKHPGSAVTGLAPAVSPSGLALKDANRTPVPVEANVIGNIVGGQYIAGVIHLSQQGLNVGSGFIRSIDYAKGELLVGADPGGVPTARVRINDPTGVYGKRNADKNGGDAFDERFAADPDNAAIVAQTGFPMCIPRLDPAIQDDPRCPRANRPPLATPNAPRRFTCGPVPAEPTAPATNPLAQPFAPCDARKPAPLLVGDYVEFNGMISEDSPGSGIFFHAAHAVHAAVGIYTSPGAQPAYVFIEEALLGTLGEPWVDIDQEQTSRFRIVGFTTDPHRDVDVFLLDRDGSERRLVTLPPSRVAQIGRIRITLPAKANFLPVTREVRVRVSGQPEFTGNGLAQGQFTAPVGEYIYPENTRFGRPRSPVSVPFENFCFLSKGGERLATLGRNELQIAQRPVVGRLQPFPESGHPLAQVRADGTPSCP